ncbi:HAMP domain-containing histidine kinase [Endozoicomonas sp. G2_1]|uniref:sensor histidine kinase n=1 Tax=Endozoicomonas sp. G2_1 TaxID=2821091 RepID=UPI001ADC9BD1|nr:HAMP domain-containing sensor histidine kinase [Endozoicomonas sp. G2_1]MBO9491727.1 HAMP domain-containing histidine kinase [Endozoicomonas sp. G2_1]
MALALSPSSKSVLNPVAAIPMSPNRVERAEPALMSESYPGELADLRKQKEQLNQVLDAMPTGLIMLDGDGIVVRVNQVAIDLLDEPILGQPWFQVIQRSFKPRADDYHEVSLRDGRRVKLEISALGNQPGQLIMITDLTETRLLQDKLSQLQRLSALGKMVSSLAHQIRTPLSAAMLYGANLANSKISAQAKSGFQEKLMSRLQDLEQQVNDMLLFAKSGRQQVVERIEIDELVKSIAQEMAALANKSNSSISVASDNKPLEILGNSSALSGALRNLIDNSIQASPQGVNVEVSITRRADSIAIDVKDDGQGIEESLREKIFEPFFTSKMQGTGLGLAVVKSVIGAHQGTVKLMPSEQGAHFHLTLPLADVIESAQVRSNVQLGESK